MLSWGFLFVFLIIFTRVMNGFKIAQQASHKKELAFQTRELMLKHWGCRPPRWLKKYLSPWSAKGHSREYQSNEKQCGYETEITTACKRSKLDMEAWSPAGILTSGWQKGPACGGPESNTCDLPKLHSCCSAMLGTIPPLCSSLPFICHRFLRTEILQSSI